MDNNGALYKVIRDFLHDILRAYPEYEDTLTDDLRKIATEEEGSEESLERVKTHIQEKMPPHFFDILYENVSLFDTENADGAEKVEFLPGLDIKELWNVEGTTDGTRATIWKYLQLILFNVVGDMSSGEGFGEAAHLFEAINEEELKGKLEETVNHFQTLFEANSDEAGDENETDESGSSKLPDPEELHNHIAGMMGGKIGSLAKEIAEDTAKELGLDNLENEEGADMNSVFSKLFRNPGKLISLVKKMGGKLDSKIKSGELKESELLEEASQFMSKMKSMPGMGGLQSMLKKMGMNGAAGGMNKASMGAMQNQMNRNMASARQRERMQAKLASRQAKREAKEKQQSSKSASVFTDGEKAERTPRVPGQGPTMSSMERAKNKRKKKKRTVAPPTNTGEAKTNVE